MVSRPTHGQINAAIMLITIVARERAYKGHYGAGSGHSGPLRVHVRIPQPAASYCGVQARRDAEMAHEPRTRLEQLANAAHLSLRRFVSSFEVEARLCGERATTSERSVKRWLAGNLDELPRSTSCRVLEHWWGEPVERLFGPPDRDVVQVGGTGNELVVNAGRESAEHAIEAASSLDPSALEHLHAAAQRAARTYFVAPPMQMLTDLVRLRDAVYHQIDRTHKPRQQAELYLIAGEVCGLLSLISWDLGNADMAEEQARAAHTYGNVIDHPSLCAWARALQVTVAFWSGRPRRAVEVATAALPSAPPGTARVRLHSVNARALAFIGARQEVTAELDAAARELDRAGDDPLLDDIGGELSFDRSRHALCTASAFVTLGDGEQAEPAAMTAVELFASMSDDLRWGTGELGAWIDLGTARALRGNLAGAEEALEQVFALAPERRTEALARRLANLGRVLGTTRYRGASEAARMGEAIEDFTTNSLARSAARRVIGPAR